MSAMAEVYASTESHYRGEAWVIMGALTVCSEPYIFQVYRVAGTRSNTGEAL